MKLKYATPLDGHILEIHRSAFWGHPVYVFVVLLDLSAAFDTVDHGIMLRQFGSRLVLGPILFSTYTLHQSRTLSKASPDILHFVRR